jgi:urea transporter
MIEHLEPVSGLLLVSLVAAVLALFGSHLLGEWKAPSR